MPPITLAVIAADRLVRAGLVSLLQGQPGLSAVISLAPDDDLQELEADVVLWDVGTERRAQLGHARRSRSGPRPRRCGAAHLISDAGGVLYRTASPDKLIAALQALAQGLNVFEPDLAEALFPQSRVADPPEDLTPRELEVLRHLAEGLSNKTIAKALDISENTVKFHLSALLGKFGVSSRTEVVVRAIQLGLVVV